MRVGKKQVLGTLKADAFVKIYDSGELAASATSVAISGLNGDTDEEYIIRCRLVSGAADSVFEMRLAGDTGNNYGHQFLYGNNTSPAAARDVKTFWYLGGSDCDSGESAYSEVRLYAKTGFIRTALEITASKIATTTITSIWRMGLSWNDTSTNITSITVLADQANGLGVGSRIEVYAKRSST